MYAYYDTFIICLSSATSYGGHRFEVLQESYGQPTPSDFNEQKLKGQFSRIYNVYQHGAGKFISAYIFNQTEQFSGWLEQSRGRYVLYLQ